MAQTTIPGQDLELNEFRRKQGVDLAPGGIFYNQPVATTALANSTTETSLLNPTGTGVYGYQTLPSGILQYNRFKELPSQPGTVLRFKIAGTLGTAASAPTLTLKAYLASPSTTYTVWNSTALTQSTSLSGASWEVLIEFIVATYGASGSIVSNGTYRNGASAGSQTIVGIAPAAVTVDTTQPLVFDFKATWGTASASNTITATYATLEIIG